MTAVASPARHVLGDKSTNTPLSSVAKGFTTDKPQTVGVASSLSPLRQPFGNIKSLALSTLGPRAGQKRRRENEDQRELPKIARSNPEEEEDDCKLREDVHQEKPPSIGCSSPIPESQQTERSSESQNSIAEDGCLNSGASGELSFVSTNFSAVQNQPLSQRPLLEVEEHFSITDEPSQRTLEAIHSISFSENQSTTQLPPLLRPMLTAEPSQDSVGMSSFIEFDEDELKEPSRKTNDLGMIEAYAKPIEYDPIERSIMSSDKKMSTRARSGNADVLEKAHVLRSRLQLAMFKVQTNQTRTPFSRLQTPKPKRGASPELPDLPLSQRLHPLKLNFHPPLTKSLLPSTADSTRTSETINSPESKIAAARARMTAIQRPQVKALSSVPMPELKPALFSAQFTQSVGANMNHGETPNQRPDYIRNGDYPDAEPRTPITLTTPRTEGDGHDVFSGGVATLEFAGVTSSVVKGEAANGLLELRRAIDTSE